MFSGIDMPEALNKPQKVLVRLIRNQLPSQAGVVVKQLHVADLADLFQYFSKSEKEVFIGLLVESDKIGEVLTEIEEELFPDIREYLSDEKLAQILQNLPTDDAADMFNLLDEEEREPLFRKLTGAQKRAVGQLLGYGEDTAGGIMTAEIHAFPHTLSVGDTIEKLRKQEQKEIVLTVYVVDEHNHLLGVAPFKSLVFASSDQTLGDIMVKDPVSITTEDSQEEAAQLFAQYDLLSLPVVDDNGKLMGVITVDDAIDVMYDEATEDMFHLANLDAEEKVFSPVSRSIMLRLPWLFFNMLTITCVAITVNFFKGTLEKYIALAVLMPVIAGMAGNAGTQALTVVVRGLALGEIDFKQGTKILFKEIRVGLVCGIIIGSCVGGIAYFWFGNIYLGFIALIALAVNLVVACLFGALIPLTLRKLNLDPALGSSMFVTMIADITGFIIFLGLATVLIDYLTIAP